MCQGPEVGPPVVRVWLEHSSAVKTAFILRNVWDGGSHLIRLKGRLSLQLREWQAWASVLLLPLCRQLALSALPSLCPSLQHTAVPVTTELAVKSKRRECKQQGEQWEEALWASAGLALKWAPVLAQRDRRPGDLCLCLSSGS